MIPNMATYANPRNTWSSKSGYLEIDSPPVHYDYIFHKANYGNKMWTSSFEVIMKKGVI